MTAVEITTASASCGWTLARIDLELACELDRLQETSLHEPDLFAEFLVAHLRTLVDELDEMLARVGARELAAA